VKICVFGIPGVPLGKHNLKDPRLDQADKLVEAKKKTYAQVDVVGDEATLEADVIVVHRERFPDLILHDLEFVETRLGRNPPDAERAVLLKIQAELEAERTMYKAGLSKEELQAVAAHSFHTHKPVIVADNGELATPDPLMLRAFKEGGFICYLTVGGKENRAWPIPQGSTAWEAAGVIHTDIQKGFIRAEIIGFEDFVQAGGETQAKRAGKLRLETKTYVMQDYDVTSFRFNK
jgi:ribosome-binding ATPase YchF (GTP1/OBG family)